MINWIKEQIKGQPNHSNFSDESSFMKNIHNYVELIAFLRFYPDILVDMITPKSGSIKLGLDQRIFLRVLLRFPRAYVVFPRGYGNLQTLCLATYIEKSV